MSIIGSIFGAIFNPTADSYAEKVEELAEKKKSRARTVGDNKEYEMQLAKQMGDYRWLAALKTEEENDEFILQSKREEATTEEEAKANKDEVGNAVEEVEYQATLSIENLVNVAENSEEISKDDVTSYLNFAEELQNDVTSDKTVNESMQVFNAKKYEVEQQVSKYQTDVKTTGEDKNPFALNCDANIFGNNNPFETNTENNDSHEQETLVA